MPTHRPHRHAPAGESPAPQPAARIIDSADGDAVPAAWRRDLAGYHATAADAGASGATVHRLTAPGRPTLYLKYAAADAADAIADEMARLSWLAGRLPVPEVQRFERTPDAAFLLTTAVPGISAADALDAEPTARHAIAAAIGEFLRQVHALPVAECPFDACADVRLAAARRAMDAGLVDESDFDAARAGWPASRVWDEMVALLPLPFGAVVTHGDWSLDNVLLADGRVTGGIDWGRAGVADPHQDLAIMSRDLAEFGDETTRAFLRAYGISTPDARRLQFFQLLDEFF